MVYALSPLILTVESDPFLYAGTGSSRALGSGKSLRLEGVQTKKLDVPRGRGEVVDRFCVYDK